MHRRLLIVLIFIVCGVFALSSKAQAGFGISPPYVKPINPIFPGSHYEQKINLLRSTAEDELVAEITINAPEIESWVSIKQGNPFDLPKDKLKVPMVVVVDIPEDAVVGNYKGHISIRIRPKGGSRGGGVAIALGARVDIDLTVTDEELLDFIVRKVDIPTLETLGRPWNWPIFSRFFYRIKVILKIENTGNAKVAPSRVQLDIYNLTLKDLLESHIDKSIKKVDEFKTQEVVASFPTKLDPGHYWGIVKVFKDKEIVLKNQISFEIVPHGELPGGTKLGAWPWVMMTGLILVIIIIIAILIKIKIWRYIWRVIYVISWPLRYIGKKVVMIWRKIKAKFWRWMRRKSTEFQENNRDEINEKPEKEKPNPDV